MFSKNKRGISTIIATLLLVVLTIVLVAVVWTVINVYNDITLNNEYSCYNSSSNQVQFSLNIGGSSVDGALVSISGPSQSKSFTITTQTQASQGLSNYPDGSSQVILPGINSGSTYLYSWTGSSAPNSIQVAPVIGGQQCSASDSIQKLDDCSLLS